MLCVRYYRFQCSFVCTIIGTECTYRTVQYLSYRTVSTVPCSTYRTVQYYTVPRRTIQFQSNMQKCAVSYSTAPYGKEPQITVQYRTVQGSTVPYTLYSIFLLMLGSAAVCNWIINGCQNCRESCIMARL